MIPWDASWAQTWSMAARPGHGQGHHDGAALLHDQLLAGHPEVLVPGTAPVPDLETVAVERALLELVDRLGPHVVPGEHRVGHTDTVHAIIVS